jgi:hypothetical protein
LTKLVVMEPVWRDCAVTEPNSAPNEDLAVPMRPIIMVVTKFPRFTQTFIMNKFVGLLERG